VPPASEAFLGYLAIHAEAEGFLGGLLILDANGDPVDFAYTEPVKLTWPTKVLFGARLAAYIATRVLAPPLLASVTVKPSVMCFDDPAVLSRDFLLDAPAAVCCSVGVPAKTQYWRDLALNGAPENAERSWWGQLEAAERIRAVLAFVADSRSPDEMIEPFERLRLALREVPGRPKKA
jgi:hypothetical protein